MSGNGGFPESRRLRPEATSFGNFGSLFPVSEATGPVQVGIEVLVQLVPVGFVRPRPVEVSLTWKEQQVTSQFTKRMTVQRASAGTAFDSWQDGGIDTYALPGYSWWGKNSSFALLGYS